MRLPVAFLLVAPTVAFAQFKCTAPDGSVSFQQTPCASAQKQQALNTKAAPARDPAPATARGDGTPQKPVGGGTVEQRVAQPVSLAPDDVLARGGAACIAAVKAELKDPYSAQITPPNLGTMQNGQWFFSMLVNAKNSYGGYTGEKVWACWVSPGSMRVLRIYSPAG